MNISLISQISNGEFIKASKSLCCDNFFKYFFIIYLELADVVVVPIELDTVDGVEINTASGTDAKVTVGFVGVMVSAPLSPPSENEKLPMDEVVVFIRALEITGVATFGMLGFSIGLELLIETGVAVKLLFVFKVPKLNENEDADAVVTGFSFVVANTKDGVEMVFDSFDPAIVVPNASAVAFVSVDAVDSFVTVMLPKDICLFVERLPNDGKFNGAVVVSVFPPNENPLGISASFAIPEPDGVKTLVNGSGCCDCGFSTVAFCANEIGVALVIDNPNDGFEVLTV